MVIIGGGKQGCELAEFLVKRGRKVTIVDTADVLGYGILLLPPSFGSFTSASVRDYIF